MHVGQWQAFRGGSGSTAPLSKGMQDGVRVVVRNDENQAVTNRIDEATQEARQGVRKQAELFTAKTTHKWRSRREAIPQINGFDTRQLQTRLDDILRLREMRARGGHV